MWGMTWRQAIPGLTWLLASLPLDLNAQQIPVAELTQKCHILGPGLRMSQPGAIVGIIWDCDGTVLLFVQAPDLTTPGYREPANKTCWRFYQQINISALVCEFCLHRTLALPVLKDRRSQKE